MSTKHKEKTENNIECTAKATITDLKQDVRANTRNITISKRLIAFGKLFLLFAILIVVPLVLYLLYKDTLFNKDYLSNISNRLDDFKGFAFIPLILLQIIQIVICIIPGQPIQFASSYLYGVLGGFLISLVGAFIGTVITYYLAKFLGNDALHVIFGEEKVKSYVRKLNSSRAYVIIFLLYLIPGIPKDVTSYIAGISNIRLRPFIFLSILGRSPGVLESLLFGTFLAHRNYFGIAMLIIASIIILLICYIKRDVLLKFIDSYEDSEDNLEV